MMAVLLVPSVTTSFISCPPPLSLKLNVLVGDSYGQPNCDRFCHRIGTTDQFCLQ